MWWVAAERVRRAAGLKTTRSASAPGAIVPFVASPNILAGAVAISSTNRIGEICPAATPPSHSSV